MAIQTQPFIDLIREAEEGTLQLPEFQRPWKWATQNVVKLFDSVRQGYPVGAFLVMEHNDNVQITPRPFFKGEPSEIQPTPGGRFILDGQQRLTAGLMLFGDRGKSRYYIDLNQLYQLFAAQFAVELAAINAGELSHQTSAARAIFLSELDSEDGYCVRKGRTLDPSSMISKHLLATAILRDDEKLPIAFAAYRKAFPERYPFIDYVVRDHFVLRQELQIPVIVVERDRSVEAICRIFSTLNTTGRPLTPFETGNRHLIPTRYSIARRSGSTQGPR